MFLTSIVDLLYHTVWSNENLSPRFSQMDKNRKLMSIYESIRKYLFALGFAVTSTPTEVYQKPLVLKVLPVFEPEIFISIKRVFTMKYLSNRLDMFTYVSRQNISSTNLNEIFLTKFKEQRFLIYSED